MSEHQTAVSRRDVIRGGCDAQLANGWGSESRLLKVQNPSLDGAGGQQRQPLFCGCTASILGLTARVGEQAATNDNVMMEPATGPET
jgi:hypothetical protein